MEFILRWQEKQAVSFYLAETTLHDSSILYSCDSTFIAFPSSYLREICLKTGKELRKLFLRSEAASIYLDKRVNKLFIPSTKNMHQIDVESLKALDKLKAPQLAHYIGGNNKTSHLLMMNHQADTVSIVDYETNTIKRKKLKAGVDNACCAIIPESEDTFLVCSPYSGIIYRYGLEKNSLKAIIEQEKFNNVVLTKSGEAFIQGAKSSKERVRKVEGTFTIKHYSSLTDKRPKEIDLKEKIKATFGCIPDDVKFSKMKVSEDEETLFIYNHLFFIAYSITEDKILNNDLIFQSQYIVDIYPNEMIVITCTKTDYNNKRANHTLSCWDIEV